MPTSYSLQGVSVIFDDADNAFSFQTATFVIIGSSAGVPQLGYLYSSADPEDTTVELSGSSVISGTLNGDEIGDFTDFRIEEITTPSGTHQILILENILTDREYFFAIGGDPLTMPTSLSGFTALNNSITSVTRVPDGPFAPGVLFSVDSFNDVTTTQGNTITGTAGDDTLTGTSGNDLLQGLGGSDEIEGGAGYDEIIPGGNDDTDVVHTGPGSDLVDYSASTTGFQELSYAGDSDPIDVYINGTYDEGDILQGDSYDTLIGVATAMDTIANINGGLSITGTSDHDFFDITTDAGQWINLVGGDGSDSYVLSGNGAVRLTFRGAPSGLQVNLATGVIANDGYGNVESILGNAWEIRGTSQADVITGSFHDESFILESGNDTLNGGAGNDRLRYDRNGVSGIDADLTAGTVTGTWGGVAFTHTISSIEHIRGGEGDDTFTAAASTTRLRGNGGADRFILADNGTLRIDDFVVGQDILDVSALSLTPAAIATAFSSAVDGPNGAQIVLGSGFLTLAGLSAVEAAAIAYVGADGTGNDETYVFSDDINGDTFIGNAGNDTLDFRHIVYGYAAIYYANLTAGITVNIDGSANTGSVIKSTGTDTLVDIANPLLAGGTTATGGLGITGTMYADRFDLATTANHWMQVQGAGGDDTFTISGTGLVRLDYIGDPGGIQANLATGIILDGYGDTDTVIGHAWELRGSTATDVITGSAANESFILQAGNDTLDGGGGFDRLRYDRSGITDGVTVNLETGTATGVWSGMAFTHTISNIEHVRGSNANDRLTGSALGDMLDGRDGVDTLVGGGGNDTLIGGVSEDDLRDVIYGGDGNDSIDGGYGNDELRGDAGNDTVAGGFGADTVIGADGDDVLTGSAWGDVIYGGNGSDFINGGFGYDRVNGGADADRFYHLGIADHGSDWIQDYTAADGDVLVFGQPATRDQFQVNFTETDHAGAAGVQEAFIIYRPTGQIMWALVDGAAQSEINLVLQGVEYDLLA